MAWDAVLSGQSIQRRIKNVSVLAPSTFPPYTWSEPSVWSAGQDSADTVPFVHRRFRGGHVSSECDNISSAGISLASNAAFNLRFNFSDACLFNRLTRFVARSISRDSLFFFLQDSMCEISVLTRSCGLLQIGQRFLLVMSDGFTSVSRVSSVHRESYDWCNVAADSISLCTSFRILGRGISSVQSPLL